jgi:hypothetical protein
MTQHLRVLKVNLLNMSYMVQESEIEPIYVDTLCLEKLWQVIAVEKKLYYTAAH